jgi:hypothetical protein
VRREPSCPDPSSGWVLEERAQYRNNHLEQKGERNHERVKSPGTLGECMPQARIGSRAVGIGHQFVG